MKIFILVITLMLSFSVYASDPTTGNVRFIGGYGDGSSFIDIDQTINEAACPSVRVYIEPNHPQIDHWLSIALSAQAQGKSITVRTFGCYQGRPTMDATRNSYLYINS